MEMWVLTTKLLQWYFLMPAFVGSAVLHNGRTALFAQNHGTNWIAERSSAARQEQDPSLTSRAAANHGAPQQCSPHNNAATTAIYRRLLSSRSQLCFTRYTLICRENYIVSLTECFWVISLIVAGITSTWNVRPGFHNGVHCSYGRGRYPVMKYDNTVIIINLSVKFLNREHLHRG